MNRLTEIANKYNTDKGTNSNCDNSGRGHGFTEFYYNYFKDLKHPIILEIGVWKGASIKMYNDFFNGDCEIYCIDIDPNRDVSNLGDNVHFFVADQGNEEQLKKFVSEIGDVKFDIILDDGSHQIYHQMLTYSVFRKLLKPNGIYIMEDLHTSFLESWGSSYGTERTTTLDFFVNFIPFEKFTDELNTELFREIKTVELFSNDDNLCTDNFRRNRSLTAIIKLKL
jgi:hypothetical protein